MSAKVSASDSFLGPNQTSIQIIDTINFDRMVDLMSQTGFHKPSRTPSPREKEAAQADPEAFHAARLFNISETWVDFGQADMAARHERIERMEDFAATLLLSDIRSGIITGWELSDSDDEVLKRELRKTAEDEQKDKGKNYHSPTLVCWLAEHGFSLDILKKVSDEMYNIVQDHTVADFDLVGCSESINLDRPIQSPLRSSFEEAKDPSFVESFREFPLDTQVLFYYRYLFSAFFLAFYEGDERSIDPGNADFLDNNEIQREIKKMKAKTYAEISALSPSHQAVIHHSDGSHHIHRRRLSAPGQSFSAHREELIHACPEVYVNNPLHLVLDYLDSQIQNYEEGSKNWEVLSSKREIVTTACRRVDARAISLQDAVNELLSNDALYKRRNILDCLHSTPRTIELIQASLLGVEGMKKLLPKRVLNKATRARISGAIEQLAVI
jgi:hypothetical protein